MENHINISRVIAMLFVTVLAIVGTIPWYYAVPIVIYLFDFKINLR